MQAQTVTSIRAARNHQSSQQRRFARWKVAIPCQVIWTGQSVTAWVENLSFGGALVHRAIFAPSPGDRVELHLCTGSDSPLRAIFQARVVHSCWDLSKGEKAAIFGLEFEEMAAEQSPRLVRLLRRFSRGRVREDSSLSLPVRPFSLPPAA